MNSELRKVVAVFDAKPAKEAIRFPIVRTWIRGRGDYVTRDLRKLFPIRGEVFLHISMCGDVHPEKHQVGLFTCEHSTHGGAAAWQVRNTLRTLAHVVSYSPNHQSEFRPLDFWRWFNTYRYQPSCSLLLGEAAIYVRVGKHRVVGPFGVTAEGGLSARGPVAIFDDADVAEVDVDHKRVDVIDTSELADGTTIVVDAREAIHRRLKAVHKLTGFEWLSRNKMQELSTALAELTAADGSEWVVPHLSNALVAIEETDGITAQLRDTILEFKPVESAIREAWQKKHQQDIAAAAAALAAQKEQTDALSQRSDALKEENRKLISEQARLTDTTSALKAELANSRQQAEHAFNEELQRLANSPATLALFGAWISPASKDTAPGIHVQRFSGGTVERSTNLETSLVSNLKASGLLPVQALEVATVCRAALACGQLIFVRSDASDLIAAAIAAALTTGSIISVETPGGLLQPLNWDSIIPGQEQSFPMILVGANRSDLGFVLGSLRRAVTESAFGLHPRQGVIIATLDTRPDMIVEGFYPFGPIIDERVLRFRAPSPHNAFTAFPDYRKTLHAVEPMDANQFAEAAGDDIVALPLLKHATTVVPFWRAFSALQTVNAADARRLFAKYWCCPRSEPSDAAMLLEAHARDWGDDESLITGFKGADAND